MGSGPSEKGRKDSEKTYMMERSKAHEAKMEVSI